MLIDLRLLRPRRNGKSTDESEKRSSGRDGARERFTGIRAFPLTAHYTGERSSHNLIKNYAPYRSVANVTRYNDLQQAVQSGGELIKENE